MKKIVLFLALILIGTMSANAAGIGYVSYDKILASYAPAKKAIAELDKKGMDIKKYIMQQELELMKTSDANKKSVRQKALKDLKAKQEEYAKLKSQKEAELTKTISAAVNAVRVEKKLDIMLDSSSVLSGGIDCTDFVLKKLNGK